VHEDKQTLVLELYERSRARLENLARALFQRFRAAASDGQGAFFTAMLCFGAAAFLFHLSLYPQRISQRYLEDAIVAEQEPLRGEVHPVLAGLLLPHQQQQQDSRLCQADGKPTPFLDKLDASYQAFTRGYFAAESPGASPTYRFEEQTEQKPTEGVGHSWKDNATSSTLVIPSIVAAAARTAQVQAVPGGDCPSTPGFGCKIYALYKDPILRSLAIERLTLEPSAAPSNYRVIGWYFISVEGVTRAIPPWQNPQVMAADRLYSGTSYFYSALSKIAPAWGPQLQCGNVFRAWTAPYFDLGGAGVVKTVCYPVSQPGSSQPQTFGVLCADLALPRPLIMAQLEQAASALDLSLVSVRGDQVHACSQWDAPCPSILSRVPGDIAVRHARDVVLDNQKRDSVLGAEGVRLSSDGDYFGITVIAERGGEQVVAVGRTRRSHYRDIVSLVGSSGLLFAGLVVLMLSYRRQLRRREAVVARGLPHGVLRLDDKRLILGANDRAQEIFDVELPGLGIDAVSDADPQAIWFDSLFAGERCVLISSDDAFGEFAGHSDKLDPQGFLAPGKCSDVLDKIEHGYTLSFYARASARWVRIGASPIVMPDLRIGTVVMVSTRLEAAHHPYLEAFDVSQAGGAPRLDREAT
jgi:PAS domain-containing protein